MESSEVEGVYTTDMNGGHGGGPVWYVRPLKACHQAAKL